MMVQLEVGSNIEKVQISYHSQESMETSRGEVRNEIIYVE